MSLHRSLSGTFPALCWLIVACCCAGAPLVAGPLVAGPLVAGPLVAGPLVAGPLVSAPLITAPLIPRAPAGGWSKVEARLKKAVFAQNADQANKAIDALAATGEARAYGLIIKYGLSKSFARVNRHAAGHLVQLPRGQRDVVFESLESGKKPVTKIILLAVVKRWRDDPAAMKALHGRLNDSQKAVVFTSLRWIRELNDPGSFPALISALEKWERRAHGRIYYDIRETLTALSGGQELEMSIDWKNYWSARKANKNFKPKKPKSGRTAVAKPPSFFSMAINSDRVVFIIDISQSMLWKDPYVEEPEGGDEYEVIGDGTTVVRIKRGRTKGGGVPGAGGAKPGETVMVSRIDAVKQELIRTIESLEATVRFNIFSFNHQIRLFDQSTGGGLLSATAVNKKKAVGWISGLRANGVTRTDLVLREALSMRDVDTVYLLTDGAPKKINEVKIPHEEVFALARALNRFSKCRIHTIGFFHAGTSMQSFVKELAKQNDGKCILLK